MFCQLHDPASAGDYDLLTLTMQRGHALLISLHQALVAQVSDRDQSVIMQYPCCMVHDCDQSVTMQYPHCACVSP